MNVRRHAIAGAVAALPALIIIGSFIAPPTRPATAYADSAPTASADPNATACVNLPTPTIPILPTLTPVPTLCPSLPPTPTPPITIPSPSIVPTSTPTPLPVGATPTPGGGGPTGGGTGPTGGGSSSGPTGGGTSSGGTTPPSAGGGSSTIPGTAGGPWPQSVSGRLVVADPLLASQVDAVLSNPVAAQRPDLLHFSLAANPVSVALAGAGAAGGPGGIAGALGGQPVLPTMAALALLAGLCVALIALAVHAQWRRLSTMLVVAPAALAIPLSAAAAVLVTQAQAKPGLNLGSAGSAAVTSASLSGIEAASTGPLPVATSGPFSTLVHLENNLTSQQAAVVTNEQQIASITATLEQPPTTMAGGPRGYRPLAFTMLTNELKQLVQQHTSLVGSYQQGLQNEYSFFLNVAQSPAQLTAVRTAVEQAPAVVQNAVNYDISVVQTQLAQQSAISGALASTPSYEVPAGLLSGPVTLHAPVSGVVTQPFGPTKFALEPPVTYNGVFYPHFHTGLDIAAPLDTPVGAAAAGVVILATQSRDAQGNLVGYGNYVVIRHADGIVTLYGHLDKILVTAGEVVQQGQVIGLLGSTGWSTGPHVHFEVRVNGVFVDPAPFIAGQIRR